MKMTPSKDGNSVCGATVIKQEPVETDPLASPKREMEYASVKEETLVEADPLAAPKREMEYTSVKEETLVEAEPLASPRRELEYASVKEETRVEADPLASPKQEMEYASVKEETLWLPEWDMPDGQNSMRDPLSIDKEECSCSEDFPMSSTFNIEKIEHEEDEGKAVNKNDGEECLSSEAFLGPNTFNTEKRKEEKEEEGEENEDEEEPMSNDDFEELKHEVESTDSSSQTERDLRRCMENNSPKFHHSWMNGLGTHRGQTNRR